MIMARDSVHIVEIAGDAGLRSAQDLAKQLRDAIIAHQSVAIATDAITAADVTTIQLLLAARKMALASDKSCTLSAPPGGVLRSLLIQTGILDADGRPLAPDGDFWTPTPLQAKGKAA